MVSSYLDVVDPGFGFDGVSTFTIPEDGLYFLSATLNLAENTPVNSVFFVTVNGVNVAPMAQANNGGNLTLIRVQYYAAGDQIAIRNASNHTVTLANGDSVGCCPLLGSAGHLCIFRFADVPVL